MKKLYSFRTAAFTALVLSHCMFTAQAQQVYKRITDIPDGKKIEFWVAANTGLTGSCFFDVASSSPGGSMSFYNEITTDNFDGPFYVGDINNPLISETIEGTTIVYDDFYLHWTDSGWKDWNTNTVLEITTTRSNWNGTAGNGSYINILKGEHTLPNTLNNGNPIPAGTWARVSSRNAASTCDASMYERDVWFKHIDGEWVWQFISPYGETEQVPDIATLNIAGFENAKVMVYPNPARDVVYMENISGEAFQSVQILDMHDREMLQKPQPKQGEGIDVSGLSTGMYILKTQNNQGKSSQIKVFKE